MLLDVTKASLLLVDMQERLLPAMCTPETTLRACGTLLKVANELAIPVAISEQYPRGLGATVAALGIDGARRFEKNSFSCWRDTAMREHFITHHEAGRPQIIVAGIEAHVCVLQSCIDFANAGFGVFAVADAISSRSSQSAQLACQRMTQNGVQIVNTEMVIFELLQVAGTAQFKTLSALIR